MEDATKQEENTLALQALEDLQAGEEVYYAALRVGIDTTLAVDWMVSKSLMAKAALQDDDLAFRRNQEHVTRLEESDPICRLMGVAAAYASKQDSSVFVLSDLPDMLQGSVAEHYAKAIKSFAVCRYGTEYCQAYEALATSPDQDASWTLLLPFKKNRVLH